MRITESEVRNFEHAMEVRGKSELQRHTVRLANSLVDPVRPATYTELSGSGILVERGGKRGIITAAHNILTKRKPGQSVDEMTMDVLLPPYRTSGRPGPVQPVNIPLLGTWCKGGKNRDGSGPDIAWIPLFPDAAGAIKARTGVFYRMEDDRKPRLAKQGDDETHLKQATMGYFAVGFSTEWEGEASKLGLMALLSQTHYIGPSTEEWIDDGWDYERRSIDTPSERYGERFIHDQAMPEHLRMALSPRLEYMGGLSGGGVWCLWQPSESQEPDEIRRQLVGMVYFQDEEKGTQDETTMINHGVASLKRIVDGTE